MVKIEDYDKVEEERRLFYVAISRAKENLYLTYTGQLVSLYNNSESGFDFNHSLGLEYRFFRNILVEFEWDRELLGYYDLANQRQYLEDFKIKLRHSFTF